MYEGNARLAKMFVLSKTDQNGGSDWFDNAQVINFACRHREQSAGIDVVIVIDEHLDNLKFSNQQY